MKFFILYREQEGERKTIELYSIFYLSEGGGKVVPIFLFLLWYFL
ncbi:hypothetical protein CLERM_773 [Coxiella-like endosymbiont]|nr:hypothetical protein CLERM_773 [Coxiella-like endosymbiont]